MIMQFREHFPEIHPSCFIAPSADIIGEVFIEENSSIWFNAVIRGDIDAIFIGKNTNIQDGCVIHCNWGVKTVIGDGVVVGHNAVLHSCTISNNCLIGMGAILLNGAVIGENCIIGAGALVTSGKIIPPNSLVLGSPAKVVRTLNEEEIQSISKGAQNYIGLFDGYNQKS
ncbi:MAG: gamma carbonic anhydrase family protein [Clostridia bacterium]